MGTKHLLDPFERFATCLSCCQLRTLTLTLAKEYREQYQLRAVRSLGPANASRMSAGATVLRQHDHHPIESSVAMRSGMIKSTLSLRTDAAPRQHTNAQMQGQVA